MRQYLFEGGKKNLSSLNLPDILQKKQPYDFICTLSSLLIKEYFIKVYYTGHINIFDFLLFL